MNDDLARKADAMLEFRKYRDNGLPVPPDVRARHVEATNDNSTTGPDPGQPIPTFSLPDQQAALCALGDLAAPNGLFLVFHRSANWCQYRRSQLVELELSRPLLEQNGVRVAAVTLRRPLLHSPASMLSDTRSFPTAPVRRSIASAYSTRTWPPT